jgi:hypothetical protein
MIAISAHANQSRIQQIHLKIRRIVYYSPDVVSFAREKVILRGMTTILVLQKPIARMILEG